MMTKTQGSRIDPEASSSTTSAPRSTPSPGSSRQQPIKVEPKDDPSKVLADWMTSPDNPFFARAMANWTWAQVLSAGRIADPPDDLSKSNPPVHPELLDARFAQHFVVEQVTTSAT